MKKHVYTVSLIGLLLLSFSCKLGLGGAIDTVAPELTVVSPERNVTVPQVITVAGSATDNSGIASITVSIEETYQAYKLENGTWFERKTNGSWAAFTGYSSGTADNIQWSVEIPITGAVSAQTYTIVVTAKDNMGNEGKSSKDERSVTVDISEPQVSVSTPVITRDRSKAVTSHNGYTLRDNNVLHNLVNHDITIAGYQKEDLQLAKLTVYIDEGTDSSLPPEDYTDYLFKKELTGSALRNWTTTIPYDEIPAELKTGSHLLRIVTVSSDVAGNYERKVQGWFTYWDAADTPWVYAEFGFEFSEFTTVLAADNLQSLNVYPGCTLIGQAYDDDGLQKVTVDVYKVTVSGSTITDETKIDSLCIENDLSTDTPVYYSWSVSAPSETMLFKVVVSCVDKNGIPSEVIQRYMNVSDVNPPQVKVTSSTSEPLLGDANGNFTITGVLTDDDKENPPKLQMVWIKNDANAAKYINPTYWSTSHTADGDIRFTGDAFTITPVEDSQYKAEFSITLNLFTDLNIGMGEGKNTLTSQYFALLATDKGNQTSVFSFNFPGDYEKPTLSITGITVDGTDYTFSNDAILTLLPFQRNSDGSIASTVSLSGQWGDDSVDTWRTAGADRDISRINKVLVTWGKNTYMADMNADGTWYVSGITPPDSSTASITAVLTDIGGNSTSVNRVFNINSSKPEFVRFSTINDGTSVYKTVDRSYGNGSVLYLTMEFSKEVEFTGGKAPELMLNTHSGATATCVTKDTKSSQHIFKYEVVSGDAATPLKVIGVKGTFACTDGNASVDNIPGASLPDNFQNVNKLEGNRSIRVDTIKPAIDSVTTLSENGWYAAGNSLRFLLTFNEDVSFSNLSNVKLIFNNTDLVATSVSKSGARSLLFTFPVTSGMNEPALLLEKVDFTGCTVTDLAGNELDTESIDRSDDFSGIKIDTTAPDQPVIKVTGAAGTGDTVYEDSVKVTIVYGSEAVKEYSIDGGNNWYGYTEPVVLTNNGSYTVKARVQDAAGNITETADASAKRFTIDAGRVLTSITSDRINGVYTGGETITFVLYFRLPVTVESTSTLTLNLTDKSGKKTASYAYGSGTQELRYTYTIEESDVTSQLNVLSLDGQVTDQAGAVIPAKFYSIGNLFTTNRDAISIMNGSPILESCTLSEKTKVGTNYSKDATLTLVFDRDVYKSSVAKYITLTQKDANYRAPAVIDASVYTSLGQNAYYTKGTNGSDSSGKPDTESKYILNYGLDLDNDDVVALFNNAGLFSTKIDIGASNVLIKGNTVTIQLTEAFGKALPVRGVTYQVTFDDDFVHDVKNNAFKTASQNLKTTVFKKGIEPPVVRIDKKSGELTLSGTTLSVTQPTTVPFRIDSQSPNAKISYKQQLGYTGNVEGKNVISQQTFDGSMITKRVYTWESATNEYSYEPETDSVNEYSYELGTDSVDTGYAVLLTATATETQGDETISASVYEAAYRTCVWMPNGGGSSEEGESLTDAKLGSTYPNLWIRGGDSVNGGTITAGFPLAWDSSDCLRGDAGIRPMTQNGSGDWYWLSWEISVPAYVQGLRGDRPAATEEDYKKGPVNWVWSGSGYVPNKGNAPVYPGECVKFTTDNSGSSSAMVYYCKFREKRTATEIKKAGYKESLED